MVLEDVTKNYLLNLGYSNKNIDKFLKIGRKDRAVMHAKQAKAGDKIDIKFKWFGEVAHIRKLEVVRNDPINKCIRLYGFPTISYNTIVG